MQSKKINLIIAVLAFIGFIQACGDSKGTSSQTSSIVTDKNSDYYRISVLTLAEACKAIDANPTSFSPSYKQTLDALRQRGGVSDCDKILPMFIGKKINLSNAGFPIALDLIIKFQGVAALDLSNNKLKDISALQLFNGNDKVVDGSWGTATDTPLKELWLQNNEISDASVIEYFKSLELLNLSNNKLESLESINSMDSYYEHSPGFSRLEVLNLADNPFTVPGPDSVTYRWLNESNFIKFLDVSNTKIQSLGFTFGKSHLTYLIANNLRLVDAMSASSNLLYLSPPYS